MWNNTDGLQQYYTDRGNAGDIPIVFIHGFPFDNSIWDAQVSALPAHFRPVTYDIRGHGLSEAGSGQYSLEFFVDDLFSLIDNAGLQKPILCGLSMGGYIALRAMERRPDAFRAFILADTLSEADGNEAKIKRASGIRSVMEKGVVAYAEDSVKNLFWDENISAGKPAVTKIRNIIERTPPEVLCKTLMALGARTDTTESLYEITAPTLILVGEHDKITPPIAAESLHERIAGSLLFVIKGAGHLTNLENQEAFNEHMLKFLENIDHSF